MSEAKEPTVLHALLLVQFQCPASSASPFPSTPRLPYWIDGYDGNVASVSAYVETREEALGLWPLATECTIEEVADFEFTTAHPQPGWFDPTAFVLPQ